MVTKATAVQSAHPLRRRKNVFDSKTHTTHAITLDAASGSVTSSDSAKDISAVSDSEEDIKKNGEQEKVILTDEEFEIEHSDDEGGTNDDSDGEESLPRPWDKRKRTPTLTPIDTTYLPRNDGHQNSPMSPNTRAWYEFDLAVVVALVSPIGNWLTGGDYIKNILLIIMLIFYLHQIIESMSM